MDKYQQLRDGKDREYWRIIIYPFVGWYLFWDEKEKNTTAGVSLIFFFQAAEIGSCVLRRNPNKRSYT